MEDGETILRLTGYNKDILESIKAFLVEPTVEQKEFTSKLFAKANAIAKEVKEEKETEQTEEENKKKDLKN